jgi:hypothetical protein
MVDSRKLLNHLFGPTSWRIFGVSRKTNRHSQYLCDVPRGKISFIYQSSDYPAELAKVHYIGFLPVALLSFFAANGWRPALRIMGICLTIKIVNGVKLCFTPFTILIVNQPLGSTDI